MSANLKFYLSRCSLAHVEVCFEPLPGMLELLLHAHDVEGVQGVHYGGAHAARTEHGGSVPTLRYRSMGTSRFKKTFKLRNRISFDPRPRHRKFLMGKGEKIRLHISHVIQNVGLIRNFPQSFLIFFVPELVLAPGVLHVVGPRVLHHLENKFFKNKIGEGGRKNEKKEK